jgi:Peptidase propeptide and YPEB domain
MEPSSSTPTVSYMNLKLTPKRIAVVIASTAALTVGAVGGAFAIAGDDDAQDRPIPAADLEQAERAALEKTGGGTVTETEVGDEESKYEVEVTLDDGTQVDVQLDADFEVVGTESDGAEDDSGSSDSDDD